jgi:hypothetical protein
MFYCIAHFCFPQLPQAREFPRKKKPSVFAGKDRPLEIVENKYINA